VVVVLAIFFRSDILQCRDDSARRNAGCARSGVATSSAAIPGWASYVNVCPLHIIGDELRQVGTGELHAAFTLGVDIADIRSLGLDFLIVFFKLRHSPGMLTNCAANLRHPAAEVVGAHDTSGAGA